MDEQEAIEGDKMKKKKKKILFVLMLTSLILVSACSSGDSASNPNNNEEIEELKTEIEDLKKENQKLTDQLKSTSNSNSESTSAAPSSAETEQKDEKLAMNKNEALIIDGVAEYTITNTKFGKKVEPSKPGSFYTYYESKEADSTYLAITIEVKNLGSSGTRADSFLDCKIKYDDKYEYSMFSTIEDRGGEDFTYTNITSIEPLKKGTLIFLAEVPKEVETSDKSITALLTIEGKEYQYKIR
ncbi:bZIP transcription factor [Paenibacillus marinisediminis]